MAFLDKINSIAKNATEKTGNMIETSKLNSKISAEERNIAAITLKIGEYFVSKMDSGDTLDSEVMNMYEGIKTCRETIDGYRNEISELNAPKEEPVSEPEAAPPVPTPIFTPAQGDLITCPLCGAKIPSNAKFCTACGAQLSEKQE